MGDNRKQNQRAQKMNECGVSETIGAVLLLGLTVVGVTIVGVVLFSQSMAGEVPAVDVLISNEGTLVLFQHNGGDSLNPGEFNVYVNETEVPATDLTFISGGAWPWSVGETLTYSATGTVTPLEDHVRITYPDNSGIFRPAYVDDMGVPIDLVDLSPAPLPTLAPGGVPPTPSPQYAGEVVAESVMTDSQIIAAFLPLRKGAIPKDRYFNFTVVSPNSTINIPENTSVGNLSPGNIVSIMTVEDDAAKNRISITGVGHTFFSLRFETAKVWIDGIPVQDPKDSVEIQNAWIPEYTDLDSTLEFYLYDTYELYIDGVLDPRSGTDTEIILKNVRPTDSGMFVINAWSPLDVENSIILAKADGI